MMFLNILVYAVICKLVIEYTVNYLSRAPSGYALVRIIEFSYRQTSETRPELANI